MCDEFQIPDDALLYLDSHHGVYIPQLFFEQTKPDCLRWHCDEDTANWITETCKDPNNPGYWDAWNDAEAFGFVTVFDPSTETEYTLMEDGDLWLIPVEEF